MLRRGEPAGAGANQSSGGDEISDDGPLDRPTEPLPHFVLMREHRGTHPDERELGERRLLGRAPRLVPRLIPAAELAGVFVAALAVGNLDVARDDCGDGLELFADLPQRRRLEPRSGFNSFVLRGPGGFGMPPEAP